MFILAVEWSKDFHAAPCLTVIAPYATVRLMDIGLQSIFFSGLNRRTKRYTIHAWK